MFTIESLIELLRQQKPKTVLQSLTAAGSAGGLEISGTTGDGTGFRITTATPKSKGTVDRDLRG